MIPKKLLLVGPMTGLPNYNREAFARAKKFFEIQGFTVINPGEPDPSLKDSDWSGYMRRSMENLLRVQAIGLLPGWEESVGARLEVDVANALNIPIIAEEHNENHA